MLGNTITSQEKVRHVRFSGISAASCFWRAGEPDRAQTILDALIRDAPEQADEIHTLVQDLERSGR